jgi:hypothetical protein
MTVSQKKVSWAIIYTVSGINQCKNPARAGRKGAKIAKHN